MHGTLFFNPLYFLTNLAVEKSMKYVEIRAHRRVVRATLRHKQCSTNHLQSHVSLCIVQN